jgi:hypothetical protein
MKKLLTKSILFFGLLYLGLSLYIEYGKMYFFHTSFPVIEYTKNVANNKEFLAPADILFLGDSRMMASLKPKMIKDRKTHNLAYTGASTIDVYYGLVDYIKHNNKPKTIVIGISYSHIEGAAWFWSRTVKFKQFKLEHYMDVFDKSIRFNDYPYGDFRVSSNEPRVPKEELSSEIYLDFWKLYLNYPFYYQKDIYNGKGFMRAKKNKESYDRISESRGYHWVGNANGTNRIAISKNKSSLSISPLLDFYLKRTFILAKSYGIKVIYQTLPLNQKTVDQLNPQFIESCEKYMSKLKEAHPEVSIHGELYGYDNKLFGDPHHLKSKGATKYTRAFIKKHLK